MMNRMRWPGRLGRYEVFYVKVVQDDTSLWVRYTLLAPLRGPPVTQVWAIVDEAGEKTAHRETHPLIDLRTSTVPFSFHSPSGALTDHGCHGYAGPVDWKLAWKPAPYAFRHLPAIAYHGPVPKTKVETPGPDLRVNGRATVAGRTLTFQGARGQQGHVWGSKHAEQWAWSHCNTGDLVWEALTARVRSGKRVTPPLTTVLVRHGARTLRFLPLWRAETSMDLEGYRFNAEKGRYRIEGRITVPQGVQGCITYTDPDGERAYCHNTKRADSSLRLYDRGCLVAEHTDTGGTAYELGQREPDPRVPLLLD